MNHLIGCVRFPYFRAEALRRTQKLPADWPLIVLKSSKVSATDYQAAEVPVSASERQARAIMPEVHVIDDNETLHDQALNTIRALLGEFSPFIAVETPPISKKRRIHQPDSQQAAHFYLDFERLRESETIRLLDLLTQSVHSSTDLLFTVGGAEGKFPAFAAALSANPDSPILIQRGKEAAFLASLPVTLLPTDSAVQERLHLLGLTTLGQIAGLPKAAMQSQFGADGLRWRQLANGHDNERLVTSVAQPVERVTRTFEAPITNFGALEAIGRAVALELSTRLQASGCIGRALTIRIHLEDGTRIERHSKLRQISTTSIANVLRDRLAQVQSLASGVVYLEVTIDQLLPFAGVQLDLFSTRPGHDRLHVAIDDLSRRYDPDRFLQAVVANPSARRIERRYRFQRFSRP